MTGARRLVAPFACSLLAAIGPAFATAAATSAVGVLPESLQAVIRGHKLPETAISIVVQEVGADLPMLSLNADVARNPASTIKLLTTWLALEELGPAYTWPTEAYLDGKLERGVLRGDLIIKGYGDPYFIMERLWRFQRQLRMRGLRSIDGDLVIDNSLFADEYADPWEFDGEGMRVYNVPPDAFLVNFQAVNFYFMPDLPKQSVRVIGDPLPSNLVIENQLTLGEGFCGGYQNGIGIRPSDPAKRDRIVLSGRYRSGCDEYVLTRSVLTAPSYAYGVFRSLWEETGGTLSGDWRLGVAPAAPDFSKNLPADLSGAPEAFVRVDSPPLSDVIQYINKYSNNVMARHLFLTLGLEAFEAPATRAKARQAANEALARKGFNFKELRLDNGAGLSRKTRIAARSLADILLAAESRPWSAEFISSLSLAGLDGTMRRRFKNEEMTGQMHLKTGRLTDVFATAGYVHARSGRDYVVVILQNYAGADHGPGQEAQSALLRWVYEQ
jgi:D-alanyl-D-alanine carboxypeptidase/D-alanyl-D-alanine-endopeptidase (penicillin-binding protein 4)